MKKYILFAIFPLLLQSCKQEEEVQEFENKPFCLSEKTSEIIKTEVVKKQNAVIGIHLTGSIEANPDKVIHFVSLVDGLISKTYFSLGDEVTQGQILAEMRSPELSSLQAELSVLKSQIEIAEMDFQVKKQLFEDGVSSNRDLLEAQNSLNILKAKKEKIESNLSLYNASSTKNVFQIKAPSSGIITAKNINSGTTVTDGGDVLFSISDLNTVWAIANIYSTDITHIKKGMETEIKTLSYPNQIFNGKIDVISQALDEKAKVLKARIVLNNENAMLKPGMIIDLQALKKMEEQKVVVPTSSLIFSNNKNYVLVYQNDCAIEIREVNLLAERNGHTYIANGLHENETIITQNQLLIFEKLNNSSL